MTKLSIALTTTLMLAPGLAFANCDLPAEPALLLQPQITTTQLEDVTPVMQGYLANIKAYQACVEGQIAQLLPPTEAEADAYFSSTEYQTQFDALEQLLSQAEQAKRNSITRYNNHVTTAMPEE